MIIVRAHPYFFAQFSVADRIKTDIFRKVPQDFYRVASFEATQQTMLRESARA